VISRIARTTPALILALSIGSAARAWPLALGLALSSVALAAIGARFEIDRGRQVLTSAIGGAAGYLLATLLHEQTRGALTEGWTRFAAAALLAATAALGAVAREEHVSIAKALLSGAALAALIVFYDAYHKQNPLSPLVMGACRVMIYVAVAVSVKGEWSPAVLIGAGALWCHLIGLTYAAKQEAFNRLTRLWPLAFLAVPFAYGVWLALREPLVWPFLAALAAWVLRALWFLRSGAGRSVPGAVVRLIAAISLLDAVLIAGSGASSAPVWALVAALGCALTRMFQRYVPGT